MKELAAVGIPVAVTCRVLKLARQPYYRWRDQPVAVSEVEQAYRANALHAAHLNDPEFGYRLLRDEAEAAGERMAARTAWRLCRQNGWHCGFGAKRGKYGTRPGPPVHDDHVRRDFSAEEPNRLITIFWGVLTGTVAALLLWVSGDDALTHQNDPSASDRARFQSSKHAAEEQLGGAVSTKAGGLARLPQRAASVASDARFASPASTATDDTSVAQPVRMIRLSSNPSSRVISATASSSATCTSASAGIGTHTLR